MKIGKVPENVLKRSVLGQIGRRREEVMLSAAVGEDCTALSLSGDEVFVMSTDPITGTVHDIGKLAARITANDLASAGAEPVGIMITMLLPEEVTEEDLKGIMADIEAECKALNMEILGGHTEITKAVNQVLISVTGVGKADKNNIIKTSGARPGMDILLTKWIGLEGTSIIAKEKREELLTRFSAKMIDDAAEFDKYISVVEDAKIAVKYGVSAMHDVTEGGIFGALWEMGEASDVGLNIDVKSIPVKQETVEICEFFGISPYELISSGSMLMAARDGVGLVMELKRNGIEATVIGKATRGNDRLLLNGEEKRFLEPPKSDELYKVVGK
ncbi:MAG: AIR synthase family protein [Lachnospiraceae bacterium]|nr:AIR synthase family protein [Lachnospiraceae bacterium]